MKISTKILSGLGITGVVATAITSSIATRKALIKLEEVKAETGQDPPRKEAIKMVAKYYALPLGVIAGTIGCIAGSEHMNAKTIASATTSLALLKKSYDKYGDAVKHVFGLEGDKAVKQEMIFTGDKKQPEKEDIFYLGYGFDNYFKAKFSDIERAEYIMNKRLHQGIAVSVADFMDIVGIEPSVSTTCWGWSIYELGSKIDNGWLIVNTEPIDGGTDHPAYMIEFECEPVEEYEENQRWYNEGPPWEERK